MLHIILFILKLIGFLILGILALLLLLTAVFLLAPFVYRAEFSADSSPESIRGSIRFHWLMHLISGHVSYENDGKSQSVRNIQNIPDSRRKNSLLPPSARKPPPAQAEKSRK